MALLPESQLCYLMKEREPDFDVIVLLGKLPIKSSEYRAAAAVSQAIMKLVPGLTCDTKFLISMARTYEQELLRLRANQGGYSIDPYR